MSAYVVQACWVEGGISGYTSLLVPFACCGIGPSAGALPPQQFILEKNPPPLLELALRLIEPVLLSCGWLSWDAFWNGLGGMVWLRCPS